MFKNIYEKKMPVNIRIYFICYLNFKRRIYKEQGTPRKIKIDSDTLTSLVFVRFNFATALES